MTDPNRQMPSSSSGSLPSFDFANSTGAGAPLHTVTPASDDTPTGVSRTRQRYLASHAAPLSSSITAAMRNQTRQRAQQQAARARSAVLERLRRARNVPTPGDYQAVEEMQSIAQAHWEEFAAGFTEGEADQLDMDQLAELEAEFMRECELAAHEGLQEASFPPQDVSHGPQTPQRSSAGPGPVSSPWPGPPWPSSPLRPPSPSPPSHLCPCFLCGAHNGMDTSVALGRLACLNCGISIASTLPYHAICERMDQARGYHSGAIGCQGHLATGYHPEEGLMVYCTQCEFVDMVLS